MLQYIRNNQMNLFCHAQVRVEVLLGALAGLTLTWRQIGRVLRSVFLLACCCREAEASAVSHFHDGNHTHFPTELLRKMLQQNRALPRSCIKAGAAFSTLLTRRGRRPGRLFPLNQTQMFRLEKSFAKFERKLYGLPISCGWDWIVGKACRQKQIVPDFCTLGSLSFFLLLFQTDFKVQRLCRVTWLDYDKLFCSICGFYKYIKGRVLHNFIGHLKLV